MLPTVVFAQATRKGAKVVSPIIEGKQKVRQTDYDSVWKFVSFDAKKKYYCNFDYSTFHTVLDARKQNWGNFTPVMNYLTTVSRAPMRICAIFAINPNITDEVQRKQLEQYAATEALEGIRSSSTGAKRRI